MSCHICNRLFTQGCLADPDANPYVVFVRMHIHGHQRLYAGKIIARGVAGYGIRTPGGTVHLVKFHRIRCAFPYLFNAIIQGQCETKHLFYPKLDPETFTEVYYDGQLFGDI